MSSSRLTWLAGQLAGRPDRLARFLHALPIATVGLDPEGRVTVWNPAAEKLFGWRAGEVLGKPHPGVPPGLGRSWSSVVREASGQDHTTSTVLQSRSDGTTVRVKMTTIPLLDEAGTAIGILAILEDLDSRETPRESEASLFDRVPVAVWEEDLSDVYPLLQELETAHGPGLERWLVAHTDATRLLLSRMRMIRANAAALEMLGCRSAREIAENRERFCTPDTAGAFTAALVAAWRNRLPYRSPAVQFLVGNDRRWGRVLVAAGPRTGSPPRRVIVSVSDITDLKRAEEAARRRDTALRNVIEATGRLVGRDYLLAVVEVLPDVLGVEWAQIGRLDGGRIRSLALFGEGKHQPPMEYAVAGTPVADSLGAGFETCQSVERLRPLRQVIPGNPPLAGYAGAALYNEEGKASGVLWIAGRSPIGEPGLVRTVLEVMADRTGAELARLEAEESLRRRETLYEDLVEHSRLAIFTDDAGGNLVYVNERFTELFGWSAEEVLGRPSTLIVHPDQREQLELRHRRRMAGHEEPLAYPVRAVTRNGEELHVEIDVSPVLEDGVAVGTRCYVKDVTGRVELERRYRQAQKMEALGTLSAGIAHDFNNMLQAILVRAEAAMLARDLPEKTLRQLEGIRSTASKAATLSRQLLAFGRRSDTERQVVDVREIVHSTLAMLGRVIGDGIVVAYSQDVEPAPALADAGELEQVVMNLAMNARDAMGGEGTLTISVRTVELDQEFCSTHPWAVPGRWVQLVVADTGHGIDPATMEHIFEPFFTTKARGKGTGLGLATAYGIVSSHGGTIEVRSRPGRGTTFLVYLPAVELPPGTGDVPEERAAVPLTSPAKGTILLAEDEPEVREVIGEVLQSAGYRVLPARDGDEAVRVHREHRGNLAAALLDLHMPGRGGEEAASVIRTMDPAFPIVLMSGFDLGPARRRALAEVGIFSITKPFTGTTLLETLEHAARGEPPGGS